MSEADASARLVTCSGCPIGWGCDGPRVQAQVDPVLGSRRG